VASSAYNAAVCESEAVRLRVVRPVSEFRSSRVPKFHLEVPHNLTADEAKSRLERFVESLQAKFQDKVSDLTQSWNDNTLSFSFKTFGFKVGGAIASLEKKLDVSGDIPIAAMMFKGKIETEIREQLSRLMRS
jgi:hypothetical protein